MEEDNYAPKQIIFSFLYGRNHSQRPLFHKLLFQFICSMNWKMRVTQEECEKVGGLGGLGSGGGEERRGHGDRGKELEAEQGEEKGQLGEAPSFQGAVHLSGSKLFTRDSGCGIEIVPSCPRGPPGPRGPEITGLRKGRSMSSQMWAE